jgi:hypothetical protein
MYQKTLLNVSTVMLLKILIVLLGSLDLQPKTNLLYFVNPSMINYTIDTEYSEVILNDFS